MSDLMELLEDAQTEMSGMRNAQTPEQSSELVFDDATLLRGLKDFHEALLRLNYEVGF